GESPDSLALYTRPSANAPTTRASKMHPTVGIWGRPENMATRKTHTATSVITAVHPSFLRDAFVYNCTASLLATVSQGGPGAPGVGRTGAAAWSEIGLPHVRRAGGRGQALPFRPVTPAANSEVGRGSLRPSGQPWPQSHPPRISCAAGRFVVQERF